MTWLQRVLLPSSGASKRFSPLHDLIGLFIEDFAHF